MIKKVWKSVAFMLALVMMLGTLTACSKKASNDTGNTGNTDKSDKTTTENNSGTDEVKEVKEVELTIGLNFQPQNAEWYDTDVWKAFFDYVEENYGYRIKPTGVYLDKDRLNLVLVSGDLPDIVLCGGQEVANTIISNNYALDLNTVKDKIPNIMSDIYAQRNQVISELTGGETGALYFMPMSTGAESVNGGINLSRGYAVRWDWYKEIGCPEINNDDDYINVLAQMVAKHPVNENGEKVYAIGNRADSFSYWYQRAAFVGPAMQNFWTYDGYLYMDGLDDNVLYNGYTDVERSAYWQDMKFYYKLNQLGIFDQDSFTQSREEFYAKMYAERYAGAYRPVNDLYNDQVKQNSDTLAGYMPVPSKNSFVFANKLHLAGYFPDSYTFISANSKNADAALAFADALHNLDILRMLKSGIQGIHWDYVDGVPTMKQETIDMLNANNDDAVKSGIGQTLFFEYVQAATLCEDGYPVDLREREDLRGENLTALYKDYSEHYGVDYPAQAMMKLVDEGNAMDHLTNYSQTVAIAREEMPSDIARILTKCNDIMFKAMPELVLAKDDAEFAAVQARVLKELESVGEPTAWEWCKQAHESARSVIKPIYEEYLNNYKNSINK